MKKYNFGAGPSILPQEVIRATAEACINFDGMDLPSWKSATAVPISKP